MTRACSLAAILLLSCSPRITKEERCEPPPERASFVLECIKNGTPVPGTNDYEDPEDLVYACGYQGRELVRGDKCRQVFLINDSYHTNSPCDEVASEDRMRNACREAGWSPGGR